MITLIKTTEKQINISDILDLCTKEYNPRINMLEPRWYSDRENAKLIFAKLLRKYRYEVLGNHSSYILIMNGYGAIKCVRTHDGDIPFSKIRKLLLSLKIEDMTITV